ncbi:CYTH domain-containing protein [Burkholderia sp. Ac-20379]|uniref:CYTH domain-containing protein n=1 Tax=Burkholderia sp. Ac-20379 TaxID=2703900 RepID=UPI00198098D3|nr:CYTH domain-containing protein [Burkholderia sp. Ac-20379]MBN3725541.1 CYTH domain-containing protein [Burkholderia sp. Ac-20379]
MAIETEIKLALPEGAPAEAAARRALDACAGAAGREIQLTNVYYDTPDLALARAKSAIRVRLAPQGWLQTFKTVGSAENGLHTRHEWELPVAGDALEIDALLAACDVPAAAEALRTAAPSLAALFRTDFARTIWRVSRGGATVEAALDLGEIIAEVGGETRRAPIREVELELIDGDETVLHTLAEELVAAVPGLAPDNQSKAQRGYRLRAA